MRFQPFALALLLRACTAPEQGNNATDAETGTGTGAPTDVPIPGGSQPPQSLNGHATPAPAGDIAFTASPESVPQGGSVTLTLENRSGELVGYNLCTSALQTADGAAVQTDRVCTMELRTLEASESTTYAYELPDDLAPGSYRLTTNVQKMDSREQLTVSTDTFDVTAAG